MQNVHGTPYDRAGRPPPLQTTTTPVSLLNQGLQAWGFGVAEVHRLRVEGCISSPGQRQSAQS